MEKPQFKCYALICSRDSNHSKTTLELFSYLKGFGCEVRSLIGYNSIFEAYTDGFNSLSVNPDDVIILCHDDIEIISSYAHFGKIVNLARKPEIGFLGVAGTTKLNADAVWWNWNQPSYMRGCVRHGAKDKQHETRFGPMGNVVVMDGVFLMTTARVLNKLNLSKPSTFEGLWDFYDINLTFQAYHDLELNNKVVDLLIRHESPGQMRESWHKNREAFIKMYGANLPAEYHD